MNGELDHVAISQFEPLMRRAGAWANDCCKIHSPKLLGPGVSFCVVWLIVTIKEWR